jgi:chromosome segregation and condensation protein ScpB
MMASTEYEKNLNGVQSAIREAGPILRSDLLRRIRHVNARDLDLIITHLKEAGLVAEKLETGAGRPGKTYVWIN